VIALLAEGNTGDGFRQRLRGARQCRHVSRSAAAARMTNPSREQRSPFPEASSLALHVEPRSGWRPVSRPAIWRPTTGLTRGSARASTSLADEFLFIDENTRGILSLQRAADALTSIVHLGVSSPVADVMFEAARAALRDVIRFNGRLIAQLDVDRFFYRCGPTTSRIGSVVRSIAARMRGTSPASMSWTCCSGCAAQTIRTMRSCSWTKMLFMLPPTRRGSGNA